jgi:hypothetical protein
MNPIRLKSRRDVATLFSLILAVVLALCLYGLGLSETSNHAEKTDFALFHHSAENLLQGRSLYEPLPAGHPLATRDPGEVGLPPTLPNLNPPFQTALFSPLGLLKIRTAYLAWTVVSLLCGILAAVLIGLKGIGIPGKLLGSLVTVNLLLFYFPTLMAVLMGQWPLVAFLFLTLAWLAWKEGRHSLAGAILGVLGGVKLFFGAFFLFFLARREWRASILFAAAGLVSVLLSILIAGPGSLLEYFGVLQGVDWFSASWNASSLGFVKRVFGEPGNDPLFMLPLLASILGRVLCLVGVVLLIIMARRGRDQGPAKDLDDLAFSSCIVLMLLISPLGWVYYFPFLLIPLTVIWRVSLDLPGRGWTRSAVILAWLMSTTPRLLVTKEALGGDPALILGWAGAYSYALVLLGVLLWKLQGHSIRRCASE